MPWRKSREAAFSASFIMFVYGEITCCGRDAMTQGSKAALHHKLIQILTKLQINWKLNGFR